MDGVILTSTYGREVQMTVARNIENKLLYFESKIFTLICELKHDYE